MTGMDTIVAIRERGAKPGCVMVELVDAVDLGQSDLSQQGIVTVQIPSTDSVADLDFRPLIGLHVQAFDYAGNRERFRRVVRDIAAARPALLVMHDDGVFHVKNNDETRSYRP